MHLDGMTVSPLMHLANFKISLKIEIKKADALLYMGGTGLFMLLRAKK